MIQAVTALQMAEIDRRAQEEYGIPQSVLMENAGRSVADEILADHKNIKGLHIAIFSGKGNNGGDGFVAARYLAECLPERLVVFVPALSDIRSGSASENLQKLGIDILTFGEFPKSGGGFDIAVDAMFGTGFRGELFSMYAVIGRTLNSLNMKVYAVDIPSGLDATTGRASSGCPKAMKTITFGLTKTGFYINDGPGICGEIVVKDIGFPKELLEEYTK
jgi:NAD(P)H-hydrate epimerase